MDIQATLGSDIAMAFDECPPHPCGHEYAAKSLGSQRCAGRTAAAVGAESREQRPCSSASCKVGVRGPAPGKRPGPRTIGLRGLRRGRGERGETRAEMMQAVEWSEPSLPPNKPRYAMVRDPAPNDRIGRPRHRYVRLRAAHSHRAQRHRFHRRRDGQPQERPLCLEKGPIEEGRQCHACRGISRGGLRHLIKAEEILGSAPGFPAQSPFLHPAHGAGTRAKSRPGHSSNSAGSSWPGTDRKERRNDLDFLSKINSAHPPQTTGPIY